MDTTKSHDCHAALFAAEVMFKRNLFDEKYRFLLENKGLDYTLLKSTIKCNYVR
jgi:hypothetical protein